MFDKDSWNFSVEDIQVFTNGAFFNVVIIQDLVIKVPKKREVNNSKYLKKICDIQNGLSEKFDSVLPCKKIDNFIIMPRADGVRADFMDDEKWRRIKKKVEKEIKSIKDNENILLKDAVRKNIIYNEEEDKFYFIDFSNVKKL